MTERIILWKITFLTHGTVNRINAQSKAGGSYVYRIFIASSHLTEPAERSLLTTKNHGENSIPL